MNQPMPYLWKDFSSPTLDQPTPSDYLRQMLAAVARVGRHLANAAESDFRADRALQDAVIRNLELIGEASRNVQQHYPDFVDQHPELPLIDWYVVRDTLLPGYFDGQTDLVWRLVQTDLPALQQQLEPLVAQLQSAGAAS